MPRTQGIASRRFNRGPAGLVIVAPLTTIRRGLPSHVPVKRGDGGLAEDSYVMCENVRSLARERLASGPFGRLPFPALRQVRDRLRILLGL